MLCPPTGQWYIITRSRNKAQSVRLKSMTRLALLSKGSIALWEHIAECHTKDQALTQGLLGDIPDLNCSRDEDSSFYLTCKNPYPTQEG